MAKKKARKRMSREASVVTLFDKRPAVGSWQLYPLTGGRLAVLEERGNPLVGELAEGDEVGSWKVYEMLLVVVKDEDELVELSMLPAEDWEVLVRKFGFQCKDELLAEFWDVLEAEFEAIRKAQAVPKKKTTTRKK